MAAYTSKELYMMNGGNTLYIYKDGYGDSYHATAAEEAAWSREVVENALRRIDQETNPTNLRFAVNDLIFHHYGDVASLLIQKLETASPVRKMVFATILWTMNGYEPAFEIIRGEYAAQPESLVDEFFLALIDFRNHTDARRFVVECLGQPDARLKTKAHTTISMWAYTGLPELRAAGLLDDLKSNDEKISRYAIRQLRLLLFV